MKKKYRLLYWEKQKLAFNAISYRRRMVGQKQSIIFDAEVKRYRGYKNWYISGHYACGTFRWVAGFGYSKDPKRAMARLDKILAERFILLSKKESDRFRNLE